MSQLRIQEEQPKLSKIDYATSYFHKICIEYTFRSIDHRFIFNHNSMTAIPSDGSMLMIVLHLMVAKVSISVIILVFLHNLLKGYRSRCRSEAHLEVIKCDVILTFYH